MYNAKTFRFMLKYACSNPARFPKMILRRAMEQLSRSSHGIVQTQFGDVVYEVDLSLHRQMRKYFHHTHEMFLERIFDRFLAPQALFFDVGANCGYWSAYALSRVGPKGEVHAFEPVREYCAFVQRLAELNPNFNVIANNVACGAATGRSRMVVVLPRVDNFANSNTNIGSSSLAAGFLEHAMELTETIEVDIVSLDDYIRQRAIDPEHIGLIKIDVEGFQDTVLDGMTQILSKTGRKIPILCEILTDLTRTEPLDGRATVERLEQFGYRCFNAIDLRPVDCATLHFEENIICI